MKTLRNLFFITFGAFLFAHILSEITGYKLKDILEIEYNSTNQNLISNNDQDIILERWFRVENKTGALIPNGSIVYFSGIGDEYLLIELANANDVCKANLLSITLNDIENNSIGLVKVINEKPNIIKKESNSDYIIIFLSITTIGVLIWLIRKKYYKNINN
jgi:hypothetical protein